MGKKSALCLCLCIIVLAITIVYVRNRSTYRQDSESDTGSVSELMQAETGSYTDTSDEPDPDIIDNSDISYSQNPDAAANNGLNSLNSDIINKQSYTADTTRSVLADNIVLGGSLGTSSYPLLSGYGLRDNMGTAISTDHRGIDFGMDDYTKLCAPVDTVISYTGENNVRGKWLVMYIGNGLYLEYQHLSELYVSAGDIVTAGTVICSSGETGVTIMPHLHLEILVSPDGIDDVTDFEDMSLRVDPDPYLGMDTSEFIYLYGYSIFTG